LDRESKKQEPEIPAWRHIAMETKSRILQISVFYKNNLPGGVGLTLGEPFDLDEVMKTITTANDAMWVEAAASNGLRALISDLRAQLTGIGQKGQRSLTDALLAIGNVYLLEKHGHMKIDDWNGLLIAHRYDT
jgi:hypothetical protein